jgi:hypothetical protein
MRTRNDAASAAVAMASGALVMHAQFFLFAILLDVELSWMVSQVGCD